MCIRDRTYGVGTWNYALFMFANGGKGLSEKNGKLYASVDQKPEMGGLQLLHDLVAANAFYTGDSYIAVSYTHLDVYKRQIQAFPICFIGAWGEWHSDGLKYPIDKKVICKAVMEKLVIPLSLIHI